MSLRDLIIETVRQELPALLRDAVQAELARQAHHVLLGEIELLFKHNPDVRATLERTIIDSLDDYVDAAIAKKMQTNDEVKGAVNEQCRQLIVDPDGPLYQMLKVLNKTTGDNAIPVIDLSAAEQVILGQAACLIEELANAVTQRFKWELERGQKRNQAAPQGEATGAAGAT